MTTKIELAGGMARTEIDDAHLQRLAQGTLDMQVLIAEVRFLREQLARARCGCLALDCRVHGAYVPEDVEHAQRVIADVNASLLETRRRGNGQR